MGPYHGFSHILLLSRHFLPVFYVNCHPLGYASFGAKMLTIR